MKNLFTSLSILFFTSNIFAQSPQKMSYQAVIRNSSNNLVVNTTVGMRISILRDSVNGTPVYVETQTKVTNANGLVSIEIGGGTIVSGLFSSINWATGKYFVKTETDIAGGTNYTITGTQQLLSVPYALYAEKANNTASLNISNNTVYTGTSPTSWTTLDLSSIVGLNKALIILKVTNTGTSNVGNICFRQHGDTTNYSLGKWASNTTVLGVSDATSAIIYTDVNGMIDWKANNSSSVKVEVVTFIK